ncbi:hypothetical protein H4687_000418 [Streptomyces stelliscabiei]|uniref:Uncharacterized protein n=1 Tax=Streptomyces stelliscabiei TaxID=146820 RepID=A0A8I0TN97_9ACTN|nr:hypothetical protein [Streptomyces stelliscabiei]
MTGTVRGDTLTGPFGARRLRRPPSVSDEGADTVACLAGPRMRTAP